MPTFYGVPSDGSGVPEQLAVELAIDLDDPASLIAGATARIAGAPAPAIPAALQSPISSLAVQVLGDSTGNADDEWVYLTAQRVAELQPAFEIRHHVYDNTTDTMPRPVVVRPGPGAPRHLPLNGAAQSFPEVEGKPITGDLDVRVRIEPNVWAPGSSEQIIACQFPEAAENARSWAFGIAGSGKLQLMWSTDGTALQTTAFSDVWGMPSGPVWVRVTLDVDNGAGSHVVTFYSSTDGATWTQLGTPVTRAGTTSLHGSAGKFQLGGRGLAAGPLVGKVYEAEIRSGIGDDKPILAPALPEHWHLNAQAGSPAGSPIFTFVNGSYPGATFAFLSDSGRLARMTPNYGQVLVLLSSSHNEASLHGPNLKAGVKAYSTAIAARLPDVPFGIITQNPRIGPANRIIEQVHRRLEYLTWGRSWGWATIDTFDAFERDDRGVAALLQADGFHPNVAGSQVWANEVQRVLRIA